VHLITTQCLEPDTADFIVSRAASYHLGEHPSSGDALSRASDITWDASTIASSVNRTNLKTGDPHLPLSYCLPKTPTIFHNPSDSKLRLDILDGEIFKGFIGDTNLKSLSSKKLNGNDESMGSNNDAHSFCIDDKNDDYSSTHDFAEGTMLNDHKASSRIKATHLIPIDKRVIIEAHQSKVLEGKAHQPFWKTIFLRHSNSHGPENGAMQQHFYSVPLLVLHNIIPSCPNLERTFPPNLHHGSFEDGETTPEPVEYGENKDLKKLSVDKYNLPFNYGEKLPTNPCSPQQGNKRIPTERS
jgi:hypothetical protein